MEHHAGPTRSQPFRSAIPPCTPHWSGEGTRRSASHSKLASSLSLLLTKLAEGICGSLFLYLQTIDEIPGGHQTVLGMRHLALKQGLHHLPPASGLFSAIATGCILHTRAVCLAETFADANCFAWSKCFQLPGHKVFHDEAKCRNALQSA